MNTTVTILDEVELTAAGQYGAEALSADLNSIATGLINIEFTITNDPTSPGLGTILYFYYAFSSVLYTETIPAKLISTANFRMIKLNPEAEAVTIANTGAINKKARYLYMWLAHEPMRAPVTVSAIATELTDNA